MVTRSNAEWSDALSGRDPAGRDAAARDLRDFLRRTLAKGFGSQLTDDDLSDLVQDSMVSITGKLDTFAGHSRFTTWAAAVAVHGALSEVRRRKYRTTTLAMAVKNGERSLQPAPVEGSGASLRRRERDALLTEAIATALTVRQREALLAELGGLPLTEVARRLGSQRGAVYKLLHDARRRLLAHFTERGLDARDLLPSSEESE